MNVGLDSDEFITRPVISISLVGVFNFLNGICSNFQKILFFQEKNTL